MDRWIEGETEDFVGTYFVPRRSGYSERMFGLTIEKLLLIGIIAVFLVGPDKLPHYAAQLGHVIRRLRSLAGGTTDRLRAEMGPEFDEVDWKKYDPRQYDPRRIIRDALLDDDPATPKARTRRTPVPEETSMPEPTAPGATKPPTAPPRPARADLPGDAAAT